MKPLLCSALTLTLLGCASAPKSRPPPAASPAVWRYSARLDHDAQRLNVTASFPAGTTALIAPGAKNAVLRLEVWRDGTWQRASMPECSRGCQLRYQIDLRRAQHETVGPMTVTSPAQWLFRAAPSSGRFTLALKGNVPFVSGFDRDGSGRYEGPAQALESPPYAVYGAFELHSVMGLRVALAPVHALGTARLLEAIERAVRGIFAYHGAPTLSGGLLIVLPCDSDGVHRGTAMGYGGASVKIHVSKRIRPDQLDEDWSLTHELVHLTFPNVGGRHRWLEEGLATYVEPLIRSRQELLDARAVWRDLRVNAPQALERGRLRFGRSLSWSQTYWGGALFYLLADLRIREATKGRLTLADALRAIHQGGGDIRTIWPPRRVFAVADRAIGAPVLTQLAARVMGEGLSIDLDALWRKLGVQQGAFDERAPWAAYRRALTQPRQAADRPTEQRVPGR